MKNQTFTRILGIIFLVLGTCGFIPSFVKPEGAMGMAEEPHHLMFHGGYLFNGFPINYALAGFLVVIGITALVASTKVNRSRTYERCLFTIAVVFTILGFMPAGVSELWGWMPLYGMNDGLFCALAMFTFYFAFVDGPLMPAINAPVHLPHK